MTSTTKNFVANQRSNWSWIFPFLLVMTFVLSAISAQAAPGKKLTSACYPGSHKFAPDFNGFTLNADGTVSVIIQFNQVPQARHFQELAQHGGNMKFSLEQINGAAYRIPVKELSWLEKNPDVAYVSPDR